MSNFNFNSLGETSFVSESSNYLKAYDIYPVNLTKIEKTTLKGKDGTEYGIVALEFKGCGDNKGVFTTNLFIPNKDADFERRVNETSGAHYPSSFEQFQYTLMQITQVINPTGAQKIIDNASKLKTIDDFIGLIIKALAGKDSVKAYLKLVGRVNNGVTYAALPSACVLGKDATAETKPSPLNFISLDESKLQFSNYELSQMKKFKEAKPTNMDKVENNPDKADSDIDLLDDIEL